MNLLKNCAVWGLALCVVLLISPVILVYGVPFATGIASDIAQVECGPIAVAVLLFIGVVGLLRAHWDAAAETMLRWQD
jgi:hypothetical protein